MPACNRRKWCVRFRSRFAGWCRKKSCGACPIRFAGRSPSAVENKVPVQVCRVVYEEVVPQGASDHLPHCLRRAGRATASASLPPGGGGQHDSHSADHQKKMPVSYTYRVPRTIVCKVPIDPCGNDLVVPEVSMPLSTVPAVPMITLPESTSLPSASSAAPSVSGGCRLAGRPWVLKTRCPSLWMKAPRAARAHSPTTPRPLRRPAKAEDARRSQRIRFTAGLPCGASQCRFAWLIDRSHTGRETDAGLFLPRPAARSACPWRCPAQHAFKCASQNPPPRGSDARQFRFTLPRPKPPCWRERGLRCSEIWPACRSAMRSNCCSTRSGERRAPASPPIWSWLASKNC